MRTVKKSILLVFITVISFFSGYLLKQKNYVVENLSDNDITEMNRNDVVKRAFSANSIPPSDLVRDKETAARIAWAVLLRFYDNGVNQNKYFHVGLRDSTTWVVEGCHRSKDEDENVTGLGGSFYMEINKRDGRISYFLLGK